MYIYNNNNNMKNEIILLLLFVFNFKNKAAKLLLLKNVLLKNITAIQSIYFKV